MTKHPAPASAPLDTTWFSGGGEMGKLVRAMDWSATPLGPVERWPRSLRTILHVMLTSHHPMFLWWGPELIQFYNDGYRPSLGADRHPAALGARGKEFWSEIWHLIGGQIESVMVRGESTWHEDHLVPIARNARLEEVYWTYSYSPVLDDEGNIGGTLVTVQETTPRVLTERRMAMLRALGERTSAEARTVDAACRIAMNIFVEHHADVAFGALYLFDAGGRLGLANRSSDALLDSLPIAPPPVDDEERGWPLERVARSGKAELVDLRARPDKLPGGPWPEPPESAFVVPIAHGGQLQPYGVVVLGVSPRLGFDEKYRVFFELVAGHLATAIANARAHEEERRRAEALAEIDRAKTAFFSNVSHEFRTPLTLMLGPLADALAQPGGALAGPDLAATHRNALRLQKLVNNLLDFSRLEAGRLDASYAPTDLATLTREVASVFRSAAEKAGLWLTLDCPTLPEPVYVDRQMWEKVLLNLLSNAFKFTFEGGITVQLRWDGGAVLRVTDTGIGIPPAELPHVFERFHRIRGARARTHEGAGIGLALVQELVRLHGGRIHAESVVERGTTFTVRIPAGTAHLDAAQIAAPRPHAPAAGGADAYVREALQWSSPLEGEAAEGAAARPAGEPARILVADDNADMREYVGRLLAGRWSVEAVADGRAALAAARERQPDLVLADVMMPGLDGFALVEALRGDPATRDIPIVLLSARAGEEATIDGLEAGADDYVVKPFTARELIARLDAQLVRVRMRQAAEQERAHLYELFMQAPVAICVFRGPELTFEMANPLYHQLAGRRDLVGRTLLEAMPEFEGQGYDDLLRGVLRSGESQLGQESLLRLDRRGDGRLEDTYWTFVYAPLRNSEGVVDRVMAYCNEVTEQVRAREGLRASGQRYRRIFEGAGVSLWDEDFTAVKAALDALRAEGIADVGRYIEEHPEFVERCIALVRIVDVNEASLRMFAADSKEEMRQSFPRIFDPQERHVFVDELLAIAAGQTRFETETVLRTLRGDRIDALVSITFPAPDESFASVLVSLTDITVRKQAEKALKSSEELFRSIADSAPAMLWMTDPTGWCTFLNRRWFEFTGQTPATGLGFGWLDAVHPDDREGSGRIFAEANRQGVAFQLEYRVRRADGEYRWAIDAGGPRRDEGGAFLGFVGAVFDFTERREAEEALREEARVREALYREAETANRVKDEFLATLSHELRTPLNAILGWSLMLRSKDLPAETRRRALEAVERNAKAQAQLIEDLLDVSRIASGKLQIKAEEVDLTGVVLSAVETIRPAALVNRLRLDIACDPAVRLLVLGDADRLQQVVWNLLTNAVKFTPPNGRIGVTLRHGEGSAEVVVTDSGQGIASDFLPHLFERFRQADSSASRRHGGLGLGLALVRYLTEAHGGSVGADSPGAGLGATFTVRLPLRAVRQHGRDEAVAKAPKGAALAGLHVLVVDDERDTRELVQAVLQSEGARVTTAGSAGEALHLLPGARFDVLIADIAMPDRDGYSLIKAVRALEKERGGRIPAVANTARAGLREREIALEAGYDWHIAKPVEPSQLVALVATAARARPRPARPKKRQR